MKDTFGSSVSSRNLRKKYFLFSETSCGSADTSLQRPRTHFVGRVWRHLCLCGATLCLSSCAARQALSNFPQVPLPFSSSLSTIHLFIQCCISSAGTVFRWTGTFFEELRQKSSSELKLPQTGPCLGARTFWSFSIFQGKACSTKVRLWLVRFSAVLSDVTFLPNKNMFLLWFLDDDHQKENIQWGPSLVSFCRRWYLFCLWKYKSHCPRGHFTTKTQQVIQINNHEFLLKQPAWSGRTITCDFWLINSTQSFTFSSCLVHFQALKWLRKWSQICAHSWLALRKATQSPRVDPEGGIQWPTYCGARPK